MRRRLQICRTLGWTTAIAVAAWCCITAVASAQGFAPDPGDTPPGAFRLDLGTVYSGVIDSPGDVDVFAIRVPPSLSVLRVSITHTNHQCEVWATSIDRAGTQVSEVFVPREGASLARTSVAEDTVFVRIDAGPFARCGGAGYSLAARLQPFTMALDEANMAFGSSARAPGNAVLLCELYAIAAANMGTRVRTLKEALTTATGSRRRKLVRALMDARRSYNRYRKRERKWCARARL